MGAGRDGVPAMLRSGDHGTGDHVGSVAPSRDLLLTTVHHRVSHLRIPGASERAQLSGSAQQLSASAPVSFPAMAWANWVTRIFLPWMSWPWAVALSEMRG